MQISVSGRSALITGGARGIGYSAAQMLIAAGAKVAIADIRGEEAARAAQQLGNGTVGIAVDITSRDDVRRMVATAAEQIGPLGIFVNSAALLDNKLFLESQPEDWDRILGVGLYGAMNCLHEVLPGMVERSYGRIVLLASDAARVGQARLSYYAAAKAAVIALGKSIAQEVGRKNITLNIVSPGSTNTPMRQEREDQLRAEMGEEKYARRVQSTLKFYPLGRLGEPEDIASLITFLASDHASWVTGQVISANGGYVMP